MKILFLTLGNELVASSRTRVFQYIPYLEKNGIHIKIIKYKSGLDYWLSANFKRDTKFQKIIFSVFSEIINYYNNIYSYISILRLLFIAKKFNVIFIQKALPSIKVQKRLFKINSNIVFDFDDAIYASTKAYDIDRYNHMCSIVKLSIIENASTEHYMRERKVKTLKITGPIDCLRYKPRKQTNLSKKIIIGWIGSGATTEYLQLIEEPLQYISKNYENVHIMLIGASKYELSGCLIINEKWALKTEIKLLEKFDIGIMPLPDNEWTRGKGGYKILQYMAMGIPSIASPVGVNNEIIVHGETGFLALSDNDWISVFEKLITDESLRIVMGENARKRAEEVYSFEANVGILLNELKNLKCD